MKRVDQTYEREASRRLKTPLRLGKGEGEFWPAKESLGGGRIPII